MSALTEKLRVELQDREYREGYDEAFLDHSIATQIRVIREQRGLTQKQLADAADMKQSRISAMEDEDYGSWSVNTLRRVAYALGVRLKVSFEEWGTLLSDIDRADRAGLQRRAFEDDPAFKSQDEIVETLIGLEPTLFAEPSVAVRPEGISREVRIRRILTTTTAEFTPLPYERRPLFGDRKRAFGNA